MSKIIILLATYNGEMYLKEQIDSLLSQTFQDFKIVARDDCSTDKTLDILKLYNIDLIDAHSNIGTKQSFSTLLEYALQNTKSEYFMFCDQDDIWDHDKVEKTLIEMIEIERKNQNMPILIHTDLKVVDKNLNLLNKSFMSYQKIEAKYNSLNNLLIQNTVTGCTMMINRQLTELSLPIPQESIMHDWWIGLVASEFGKISYLDKSTISYRQHAKNSIGAKKFNIIYGIKQIFKKDILLFNIRQAQVFLINYEGKLDNDTIKMLVTFSTIKLKTFFERRRIIWNFRLLKQGLIRNIGLFLKV